MIFLSLLLMIQTLYLFDYNSSRERASSTQSDSQSETEAALLVASTICAFKIWSCVHAKSGKSLAFNTKLFNKSSSIFFKINSEIFEYQSQTLFLQRLRHIQGLYMSLWDYLKFFSKHFSPKILKNRPICVFPMLN